MTESKSYPTKHVFNLFILMSLGLIVTGIYFSFPPGPLLNYYDAYDYTQIARNIAEGRGYVTKLITPLSWSINPEIPHRDLWRPPLYPHLVAAGFVVSGYSEIIPVLVSVLAFLLTSVFVYVITNNIVNSQAALISGVLLLTCAPLFRMGVYATTESTFTLIYSAVLLVLTWDGDHPVLFGILSGLAYLTRFNAWFFIFGALLISLYRSKRKNIDYLVDFLIAFSFTLTPWVLYNVLTVGFFLYNIQLYQLLTGTLLPRTWGVFFYFELPSPIYYILFHPLEFIKNWWAGLYTTHEVLFHALRKYWIPMNLCLISIVEWRGSRSIRKTKIFDLWNAMLIGLIVQTAFLAGAILNFRLFLPFLPVVAIIAGIQIDKVLRKNLYWGRILFVITVAVNLYSLNTLHFSDFEIPKREYYSLKKWIPPNELVLSNKYFFLPLYADRNTLALPKSFEKAESSFPQFNYVFLHEMDDVRASFLHKNITDHLQNNQRFKQKFSLLKKFPSGGKLYVRSSYFTEASNLERLSPDFL